MAEFGRIDGNGADVAPGVVVMLREAERWTRAQGELLSGVEAMWARWAERQRVSADAATAALAAMTGCRTLGDALEVQRRWFAEVMQRHAANVGAFAGDVVALGQLAAGMAEREDPRGRMPRTLHTVEPAATHDDVHRQAAE